MKSLNVAFHDVSADHLTETQIAFELFRDFGFKRVQLAVIPGSEFSHPLNEKLTEWEAEYWIHGWKHKADPILFSSRSWLGKQQLNWTNHEAEHAGLSIEDSQKLLNLALESAQKYSVSWKGYTPPTWWAPVHLKKLVLKEGLSYEGRMGFWHRSSQSSLEWSIPISLPSHSSDSVWMQSLELNKALIYCPTRIRLVLHPGDIKPNRISALTKWLEKALIFRSQA